MDWLNYHHLMYFYLVAKTGSIAAAGEQLDLAQPTLSVQIKQLEKRLGEKLFRRVGRSLEMTETGRMVYQYAEDICNLGQELLQTLKGRPENRPMKVNIGIVDVLPKLIVQRLIEPILAMEQQVQIVCYEGHPDELVNDLVNFKLDMVISDSPVQTAQRLRVFNHLLGECGITVFAVSKLAKQYRDDFPASLNGAPWLLPLPSANLRRSLDQWFDQQSIHPQICGEFADSALIKAIGRTGKGLFALPSVIESDVTENVGVEVVGRISKIHERFYAITAERRIKHPAVKVMTDSARSRLFNGVNASS